MDILIKSFNRPYYLDRCLRSVYEHIVGEFSIKILDDGTPPEYLARIRQLYPKVTILYSPQYEVKAAAIAANLTKGAPYVQKKIPTDFWIKSVRESTNYFLLLEDDIWLTGQVDIDGIEHVMRSKDISLLRLSWQGNPSLVSGGHKKIDAQVEQIIPQISNWHKFIFTNKWKSRSIGYRLGFFHDIMPYQLSMYVLYAVASAFFSKEYWLYLWQGAGERVLEEYQLQKALHWYEHHTRYGQYAKVLDERAETSYLTSTNNSYSDLECDMMLINHRLNKSWLLGELDSMQGWPNDFSFSYLTQFLENTSHPELLKMQWVEWVKRFKSDYSKLGCIVGDEIFFNNININKDS